jgi:hypoxanthine phosphoribosyltransferase
MTGTPNHRLRCVIPEPHLRARIRALADDIAVAHASSDLLIVYIDEGARRFALELCEALEERFLLPDTMAIRAIRTQGTDLVGVQVGRVDLAAVAGRDVLLLDDIADEGRTLEAVSGLVEEAEPRSVEMGVLVSKSERRRVELAIKYVGFEIETGWVVGFGMDLDGKYRELDYIAVVDGVD